MKLNTKTNLSVGALVLAIPMLYGAFSWYAKAEDAHQQVYINAEGVEVLKEIELKKQTAKQAEERLMRKLCAAGAVDISMCPPLVVIQPPTGSPPDASN